MATGVDPEADMLAIARRAALDKGTANAMWVLGGDGDVPALSRLLGGRAVGAWTVAVAVHFIDRDTLFEAARPRPHESGQDGSTSSALTRSIPSGVGAVPQNRPS
ncbi:hypothetical protein [Micromonospora sp. NPDC049203]|uniref:hypothetical protein n=1 Tax=Micromonospora sp. NPDC049203 TaxID=3364267 RepID=UPI0037173F03